MWRSYLAEHVDARPLAVFRICFGLLTATWCVKYLATGGASQDYIAPEFFFKYQWFGWVAPVHGDAMLAVFVVQATLALLVAAGAWYRLSAPLLALVCWYLFLCDASLYQNHLYLQCLLATLLAVIPAQAALSFDLRRGRVPRACVVPRWAQWLVAFQVAIPYLFGGLLKIDADWLQGRTLGMALERISDWWIFSGPLTPKAAALALSWSGLFVDLLMLPGLLWRRTRPFALALSVAFHLINSQLFTIGFFPWLMISANVLFFERPARPSHEGTIPVPRLTVAALALYVAVQLVTPARQWLYSGNVSWHGKGALFSWRMMIQSKTGRIRILAGDLKSALRPQPINPARYLSGHQIKRMIQYPEYVRQFAHFVSERLAVSSSSHVPVRAEVQIVLNGRPPRQLIDRNVDLAAEPFTWSVPRWIMPFSE